MFLNWIQIMLIYFQMNSNWSEQKKKSQFLRPAAVKLKMLILCSLNM